MDLAFDNILFKTCKIAEDRSVKIPKKMCEMFEIKKGDEIAFIADYDSGIIIVKFEDLVKAMASEYFKDEKILPPDQTTFDSFIE